MRHNQSRAVFFAALMLTCSSAAAVDPESAKAYCEEVRQAAKIAQQRFIQTAVPRQDPSRTFNDATGKCLEWVARQEIPSIPYFQAYPAVQKVFSEFAVKMLQKQCQEAGQQFNKSVNDALQSVNEQTNEYGVVVGHNGGSNFSVGRSGAQQYALSPSYNAPKPQPVEEPGFLDRVVNFLGGGD